jgi:hypothetical protein
MEPEELVIQYIEDKLPPPQIEWGRREFDQRIYERWAADEILGLLLNRGRKDPIAVVEGYFLSIVAATSTCMDNKKLIFSSAVHTAEAILNLLSKEQLT